jgi:hypothetical protein
MAKDTSGPKSMARARRKAARAGELATTAMSDGVEDASSIQADRVEVRMGAVGRADTDELQVVQGAVGAARATDVSVQQGALGAALAGTVTVRQSIARSILAREARVEQSFVRTVVAAEVHVERATGVGVLIARRVSGDVRVLLDWRGAAAFGAAFGFVVGLFRLRGRGGPGKRA